MSTISVVEAAEHSEAAAAEANGAGGTRRGGHPTPTERAALGRTTRARVKRSVHATWEPSPDRRDPVELLEEQGHSRVQELVPLRYERMLASPFAFFRGGAYLMAADLAGEPRTGLEVQLCGDAHLANFGVFAAPDRRMVISINDFDESLPGPFEWDVKRLVASFAVAGRDRNFDAAQRDGVNRTVVSTYRKAMHEFAGMRTLDVWYLRLDADKVPERFGAGIDQKAHKRFARNLAKAKGKTSMRALAKLTRVADGRPRLISDPPLLVPIEELAPDAAPDELDGAMRNALRAYRRSLGGDRRRLLDRFDYTHAARKVVGVGSVGTRAWVVLLTGRDGDDPLFLQCKEAQTSVLEPFLGKSRFAQHGQRVVEGQRLMQSTSDILLGWVRSDGLDGIERDFYVRQLWDQKGSALIERMDPAVMSAYARICGWTLARAHARSGDAIAIASYLGAGDRFDRALAAFAEAYADQNERDHRALADAVAAGRVTAATSEPAPR
jgi:uncharacterized protein (DUF2252 family)